MIISRSIQSAAMGSITFFLCWVIFCCVCVYISFYAFICHWALRLFPCLGYWNSAAMNIGVHEPFWVFWLVFFMLAYLFIIFEMLWKDTNHQPDEQMYRMNSKQGIWCPHGSFSVFSLDMTRSGIAGSYSKSIFSFFEEPPY